MFTKKINMDVETISNEVIYCYSYHRISSKRQARGGGIKRQVEASEAICNEMGWTMDTSFKLTDIGKSAYHGKNLDDRAALGSFLNAVDAGLIQRPAVLLVESLDRLSRADIMTALELFIRILNADITIYTSFDRMTYNKEEIQKNFSPLLISITLLCRSHEESETKSKRIKKSWLHMEERMRNGGLGHSQVYPFWIDISSGKPKVIKKQAQIVKDIFRLCTVNNLSLMDIANVINKKYGDLYHSSNAKCQRLMYNQKVLGLYEAKDKTIIKAFPAIIDKDTFYLAQSMLQKRKIVRVGRPEKRAISFFRGFIYCNHCGSRIVNTGQGIRSSYICHSKQRKNDCGQKSSLTVDKFQKSLLYALSLMDQSDMMQKSANTEKARLTKLLGTKEAEATEKRQRLDNLVELIASGSKAGTKAAEKTEIQLNQLEFEIDEIISKLEILASPSMIGNISKIKAFHKRFSLELATKEDQEPFLLALENVVEKIVVSSPKPGYRTSVKIHLLSGIVLRLEVEKDYSTNIYKGNKRIGRYNAPPKVIRRLKTTPHGNIKHGRRSKYHNPNAKSE
ncbi:recombinase family protein [Endozoicomonas sp. SESOKO1]|uniref:recombinase family protein n=1 Tax=Endozoicomonas sp. SESOKO1 TaxID=2828742 RepID=UPI0021474DF1|nr:recombinase family protein [Endozoicomonas sp. SESOKO1]